MLPFQRQRDLSEFLATEIDVSKYLKISKVISRAADKWLILSLGTRETEAGTPESSLNFVHSCTHAALLRQPSAGSIRKTEKLADHLRRNAKKIHARRISSNYASSECEKEKHYQARSGGTSSQAVWHLRKARRARTLAPPIALTASHIQ